MSIYAVLLGAIAYIALLFLTAWRVDAHAKKTQKSLVNNPHIYSLSLAVYCTAWTYFGSVGRASTGSMSFLAVYLGPTLTAPLWLFVLRKMILISKHQRITSIADFISARYGKNGPLATLVTVISVLGIIPYISIQLKAVTTGVDILTAHQYPYFKTDVHFYADAAFWVTGAMILFTVLFGTRKIDPNERHEGLVAAIAFESIVKLLAFWVVGLFVVYSLYNGPADLFGQAFARADIRNLFSLRSSGVSTATWSSLMVLSAFAFLLLPRQFHISVVENTNPRHLRTAMWMLPLYLLLINVFVFPIALAGKMQFGVDVAPDSYVLALPIAAKEGFLSLLVFIGGFSAATSMVIMSSIALSIMISNHLVVPTLLRLGRIGQQPYRDGTKSLIYARRWSIIAVMLMAYVYLKSVGGGYDLVSVGLISFTAVAQFAPATFGGLYWKGATPAGAMSGLIAGFLVWAYCLPLTSIADAGFIPNGFIEQGLGGIHWLRPRALFGLEGLDSISNAAWWSLLFNILAFVGVSIFTKPSALSLTQADLFVNIHRYTSGKEYDFMRREAKMSELIALLSRFLGKERVMALLAQYEELNQISLKNVKTAESDLINFLETQLSGAIGSASARLMIESVSKEENITLEEVMQVLEQTHEVMQYSRALEAKSAELEATTLQLTEANIQLKTLDRMKADFITTVTHELRTPVTSIKSLSKILLDYRHEMDEQKIGTYLEILVSESERISRLINQVLDIEKIRSEAEKTLPLEQVQMHEIIQSVLTGMEQLFKERNIVCEYDGAAPNALVEGHKDRLIQVIVNLLSNAYKFCDPDQGKIQVKLAAKESILVLRVSDNGRGIPPESHELIFGQFTQLHFSEQGKPQGTGLGLFITRQIVLQHKGRIHVESQKGKGASFVVELPMAPVV